MRRVAITGFGVVSPLGQSAGELFEAARAGRSAIHRLETADSARLAAPLAATVADFDGTNHFEPPQFRQLDRVGQFALVAARRAVADAGGVEWSAAERTRTGVFVGTGMGGALSMDDSFRTLYGEQSDRISPTLVLRGMHNAPAGWIGIEFDLRGPNLSYATACSSSAVALGEAWLRLSHGSLNIAIAGGTEAPLSLGSLKAWEAMHTLARIDEDDPAASCKPFAKNRTGMVLGEGAAMLVLEPWDRAVARGAAIHGELLGYGLTTDAVHITRPTVDGQAAAIQAALDSAKLPPEAVDSINAHGTGTPANDAAETGAIRAVFGARADRIPISATKSMHGHLLGAAGALECVLSLLALKANVALPTMHLREPDPACDLDYVANAARPGAAGKTMLSHSFAFGGTNAVLALRAVD